MNSFTVSKIYFDSSEENIKVVYKIFKNKLRSVIRKAETDYYKNFFNSKTQSIKKCGKKEPGNLLNTKKKSKGNSISKLIINNQQKAKDTDILNDHFTKLN